MNTQIKANFKEDALRNFIQALFQYGANPVDNAAASFIYGTAICPGETVRRPYWGLHDDKDNNWLFFPHNLKSVYRKNMPELFQISEKLVYSGKNFEFNSSKSRHQLKIKEFPCAESFDEVWVLLLLYAYLIEGRNEKVNTFAFPGKLNENECGYFLKLETTTIFLSAAMADIKKPFVVVNPYDYYKPVQAESVYTQSDNKWFYLNYQKLFVRRNGKFLTFQEVRDLQPQIKALYPEASFRNYPVEVEVRECGFAKRLWVVGEQKTSNHQEWIIFYSENQTVDNILIPERFALLS